MLIAICVMAGITGYRQGFLVGVLSAVGFFGGGALGVKYAPALWHHLHVGQAAPFGLAVVVAAALIGQVILTSVAFAVRRRMGLAVIRIADSIAGAAVSIVPILLVAWAIGTSLAHTAGSGVSREVRGSAVLRTVDRVVPAGARTWFAPFRRLLDENGFPEVFGGIGPDPIVSVAPPDPALAHSRAVQRAEPDVVKVRGNASACSRQIEGSGFVFAVDRIMTNAHVVAGVSSPVVTTTDGRNLSARVVLYDPNRDIAVLLVPGLNRTPLPFSGPLPRGHNAIVAGYPENGPFTAVAARVRDVENARGTNIYQNRQVTREIYSLYAKVQPGNSGGPLLTTTGSVAGLVFAAAVGEPHTGYALTAAEVAHDVAAGRTASTAVSSQGCD